MNTGFFAGHCLLETKVSDHSYYEPVPGMQLKMDVCFALILAVIMDYSFIHTPDIYSFELTAAILSNPCTLHDRETLNESVGPGAFLMDNTCSKAVAR